ncbi:hypothetical protein N7535_001509 [Penicillium sp. DV-2018c]|nr:hypothetical protein N7461_005246 [Penicillium sp. DV-2018c]KAJ5582889.1 hypothetical protein N7535_001509 [Penicillium sp. DV-2018c]
MIFVIIIASALTAVLVAYQAIRSIGFPQNRIPEALEPRVSHSAVAFAVEVEKIKALEATVEELKGAAPLL